MKIKLPEQVTDLVGIDIRGVANRVWGVSLLSPHSKIDHRCYKTLSEALRKTADLVETLQLKDSEKNLYEGFRE